MEIRLDGRTAIVTGGSKGIGLAIARCFAEAGADVAIVARDPAHLAIAEKLLSAAGPGQVIALSADVSTAAEVVRVYDAAMRRFGKLDIVVNNVGTSRAGAFESLSDEAMQSDLDLKLFSAIRLARLVWPQMKDRSWGRVINILSIGAKTPGARGAPTAITRAAGMALTKVLAGEGAPHNILVNALLVGIIETDQWHERARNSGVDPEEYMARAAETAPMGRFGQPDELARLACFLASEAGSYINGTAINVDGGKSPVV